ncbi:MAG: thymidylate synthase [Planctomycetota bacterium]
MRAYLDLLQDVLDHGVDRADRTGTGTRSVFGRQLRFDLSPNGPGFPLLTTKKVHFKSVLVELLWFLRGDTNVRYLHQHGVTIWDEWADPDTGELGPVYGKQWRRWQTADGQEIDQLREVVRLIIEQPQSRRMLVNAWNVGELPRMALPPCHTVFQFYVSPPAEVTPDHTQATAPKPKLSCHLFQRSADLFLGVPFNIASYALLTRLVAHCVGYDAGELVHTLSDTHVYHNHFEQVNEQLSRKPKDLPTLRIADRLANGGFDALVSAEPADIELLDYAPHPRIPAPVAV